YADFEHGLGGYLCSFLGYLGTWYQRQHSNPLDPAYTAMAGFVHVSSDIQDAEAAVLATLEAMIHRMPTLSEILLNNFHSSLDIRFAVVHMRRKSQAARTVEK